MINKSVAEAVLLSAVSEGAEFAELFVENNVKNSIGVVNGKVERANSGTDYGCGIRIINKDKVVYVYTNKLDRDNLVKLAGEGAKAIKGENSIKNIVFSDIDAEKLYVPEIMPESVAKSDIVNMLRAGSDAAYSYDALITQTNMGYLDSVQNVIIANTEGLWAEDERVRTRISVSAVPRR